MACTFGRLRLILSIALAATTLFVASPAQAHDGYCPNNHELPYTPPGFATGTVSDVNERDYWQHTALIYSRHTYTLTDYSGDADLYVYNAGPLDNGGCTPLTFVCSSVSAGGTDRCAVSGRGTFYALVQWYSGTSVPYRLTVTEAL